MRGESLVLAAREVVALEDGLLPEHGAAPAADDLLGGRGEEIGRGAGRDGEAVAMRRRRERARGRWGPGVGRKRRPIGGGRDEIGRAHV